MNRRSAARILSRQAGISLIELLLALALTAMLMVPLLGLLRTTAAASSNVNPRFDLERQADFAVQRIAAQVRAGAPIANYSLNGARLIETNGTVVSTLAESVTAFEMTVAGADSAQPLLTVSLSLSNGAASTSATTVVRMGTAR